MPPLADIRTLAIGFRDFSAKSIPPPPPEGRAEARAVRSQACIQPTTAALSRPVAMQQRVPKYPANVLRPHERRGGVLVDENGAVQSADDAGASIDPTFDQMVLAAAKKWRYQPATMDGMPVKFLKRLSISVSATAALTISRQQAVRNGQDACSC